MAGEDKIDLTGLADEGINQFTDLLITDDGRDTFINGQDNDFMVSLSGVINLNEDDFIFS